MPTEKYAGVEDVLLCSGDSASHDWIAKTTATLLLLLAVILEMRGNGEEELTSRSFCNAM
jgi:hypothetical protein